MWKFTPATKIEAHHECKITKTSTPQFLNRSTENKSDVEKDQKIQVLEEKLKNLERVLEFKNKEIDDMNLERKDYEGKIKEKEEEVNCLENKLKDVESRHAEEIRELNKKNSSDKEDYRYHINLYEKEKEEFERREQDLIKLLEKTKTELQSNEGNLNSRPKYLDLMKSKEKYKSDAFRFNDEIRTLKEKLKNISENRTSVLHVLIEKSTGKVKRSPLMENLTMDCTQQVCAVETDDQVCQHIVIIHNGNIRVHRSNVTCI